MHDAVRPLASQRTWASVIAAIEEGADGAVPCVPVLDTIKQRQEDGDLMTLDRARRLAVQTPQAFSAASLRAAHAGQGEATDDAALVEAMEVVSSAWQASRATSRSQLPLTSRWPRCCCRSTQLQTSQMCPVRREPAGRAGFRHPSFQ